MPKEYVITQQEARTRDELGGARRAIRVGWNREAGWIQLASVLQAGTDGAFPGQNVSATPDEGVFVDLDRQSLNDLIRLLRKARDQAHGRDE